MNHTNELSSFDLELVHGGGQVTQQQYVNCVTTYTAAGTILGAILGGGVGATIGGIAGGWYGSSGACAAVGSYKAS